VFYNVDGTGKSIVELTIVNGKSYNSNWFFGLIIGDTYYTILSTKSIYEDVPLYNGIDLLKMFLQKSGQLDFKINNDIKFTTVHEVMKAMEITEEITDGLYGWILKKHNMEKIKFNDDIINRFNDFLSKIF